MILSGQDRSQTHLFTTYDDMIGSDNPVRILDYLVNRIIEENQASYEYKGQSNEGRPAYPFSALVKLYIYGYMNRVRSTRALEKECHRNVDMMWLLQGLKPDFKTIANFRAEYGELIDKFSKAFRGKLKELGYMSKEFAVDGSKFKANANRDVLTRKELVTQLSDLDKALQSYFQVLDEADKGEVAEEAEMQIIKAKIQSLESEVERLNNYISEMDSKGNKYLSLTDNDCDLMRSRDGIIPAYNVQIAVDSSTGFIGAEYVTNASNDINELKNIVETTIEELGEDGLTTISDCGYAKLDDIEKLEQSGKATCYSALPTEQRETGFRYDEERDIYLCPMNKEMKRIGFKKGRGTSQIIKYRCSECDGCSLRSECTNSKLGRQVQRYTNQKFRDEYRRRMEGELAKSKIRKRKSVVECVFGSLKIMGGKIPLLTRGLDKVGTEIKLYTLSYNIKHFLGMITLPELIERWALAMQKSAEITLNSLKYDVIFFLSRNNNDIRYSAS
jgi:transposase